MWYEEILHQHVRVICFKCFYKLSMNVMLIWYFLNCYYSRIFIFVTSSNCFTFRLCVTSYFTKLQGSWVTPLTCLLLKCVMSYDWCSFSLNERAADAHEIYLKHLWSTVCSAYWTTGSILYSSWIDRFLLHATYFAEEWKINCNSVLCQLWLLL